MNCQHCDRRKSTRPRKLCWKCFENLDIRGLYQPKNPGDNDRDQTMAELDAMIAEQSKTLPRGWVKGEQS